MKKDIRIILVCWEFPGYNTDQGAALSKRPGLLANGLSKSGYEVLVITRNHFSRETVVNGNIHSVCGPARNYFGFSVPLRKLMTLFFSIAVGDLTGLWGIYAYRYVKKKFLLKEVDIVISFFTPRGPVLSGFLLKRRFNCKWIVDLQDTFDEGLGDRLFYFGRIWFQYVLKSSDKTIHVSPEWSVRDGQYLGVDFNTIRHALPDLEKVNRSYDFNKLKIIPILYYGSLDINHQFHPFFFDFLRQNPKYQFNYAGAESTDGFFSMLKLGAQYNYLGYLERERLFEVMEKMAVVIIFSYTLKTRQVVPSKLYEVIGLGMPCIIVGEDSGGIESFEKEFNYKFIHATSIAGLDRDLAEVKSGFNPDYSIFEPLSETNFVRKYLELLEK